MANKKKMSATLKFDLPDYQEDFDNALNGFKYKRVVQELKNYLRAEKKYNNKETLQTEEVQSFLIELLKEYDLLDKIM